MLDFIAEIDYKMWVLQVVSSPILIQTELAWLNIAAKIFKTAGKWTDFPGNRSLVYVSNFKILSFQAIILHVRFKHSVQNCIFNYFMWISEFHVLFGISLHTLVSLLISYSKFVLKVITFFPIVFPSNVTA